MAKRRDHEQPLDLRALQGVSQLLGPIGRIDIDQDGADPRSRHLQQQPLPVVGGPDADAITGIEADSHQAACELIDGGAQLGVGEPPGLGKRNHGLPVGIALRNLSKMFGNSRPQ